MAIGAAMRAPVRSGLENSYRMISDELMRVGEAQRLGGSEDLGKAVSESIKPALEMMSQAKRHVSRNRAAYIAGGLGALGGVATGAAAAGIAARNRQKEQD